ncbi:tetratricopeptide repeat protein 29 isoform X2 [Electrophorus electricus]|uniref:tetratricopeptide repeat protein 29 isoform X2 n=1 Tax=Electrophorus electricus TaxID=8005 RepID=UPI0015D0B7AA|nr:tetratricopeptide repeat protein 29 isoform X2 [Electrophorus electricus]
MTSSVLPGQKKTRFLPDINAATAPTPRERTGFLKARPHHELDTNRHENASGETPVTEDDIAQFRNTLRQNLCVSMLREGFHRSFAEFFSLLERWRASREAAGPGSALWQQRPLEKHPRKLEPLREHLTRAESAERAGQYVEVYENYLALARFFSEPEDRWIRYHFYELSLLSAGKIKMDSGKREAEANGHMGEVYLEQGDFELAREHYEVFYNLAVGRLWQDESGNTHHSRACMGLCRIYTLLAQRQLQTKDYRTAIQILTKAYDMAKEGGERRMEGEAAYRVGLAYQCKGDQKAAKEGQYDRGSDYFSQAYELACSLGSVPALRKAQACVGVARAHALLRPYSAAVVTGGPRSLLALIRWKEVREDGFVDSSGEEVMG